MTGIKIEKKDFETLMSHLIMLRTLLSGFAVGGRFSYNPQECSNDAMRVSEFIGKLKAMENTNEL